MSDTSPDLVQQAQREARAAEQDEAWYEDWSFGQRGRRHPFAGTSLRKRLFQRTLRLVPRIPGLRLYAAHVAPRRLRLERVAVPLPGLPVGLVGLRIGFLSDIHHDQGRPLALLARGVALLNAAAPDVIVLGGDYVVGRGRGFAPCARLLGRLRAPLGVYAILGNHDHWGAAERVAAQLTDAGATVLRNASRRLVAPGGAPFWLLGLDSGVREHADPDAALAGVPEDAFRLLLAHEPQLADVVRAYGARVDLQLSGHTHGGQIVPPLLGPIFLPPLGRHYLHGLYQTPGWPLYVSRGIGGLPPFLHFRCPPEVTLLTLAPGALRASEQDGVAMLG